MLRLLRFLTAGLLFAWQLRPRRRRRLARRRHHPKPQQETGFLNRTIELDALLTALRFTCRSSSAATTQICR